MSKVNYIHFASKLLICCVDGLNLMGVAIGNGVMDYYFQEQSYTEYAYSHGLIPLGAKMKIDKDWIACIQKVRSNFKTIATHSFFC